MTLFLTSPTSCQSFQELDRITLPGALGNFTVLRNHAPMISSLNRGRVVFSRQGKDQEIDIEGGIVEINHNTIQICLFI